jgi:hypothetical protein
LKGERTCEGDAKPRQGGVSDPKAEHFSSILKFEALRLVASLQRSDGIPYGLPLLHCDLGIRWGWVLAVAGNIADGEDIKAAAESQISIDG